MSDWDRLSESAQKTLVYLAECLAGGFSGEFRIVCQNGGVHDLHEIVRKQPKDLPKP